MIYSNLPIFIRDFLSGRPGLTLAKQDVIGLYLEKDQLHYIYLTWTRQGLRPTRPGPSLEPYGSVQEPAPWSLKQFLEWMNIFPLVEGHTTAKTRLIYLGLSRNRFFARDLELPPMPMEDALESVKNSLPVCCHLPLEEIYYDIHLCRQDKGNINALILYGSRKDMDVYLNIFRETGHLDSLRGLFPISYGMGAWLSLQQYPMPLGLILRQDSAYELAIYQKNGCLFSGTWPVSEGIAGGAPLINSAKSKFQVPGERIFHFNNSGEPTLALPSTDLLEGLPSITENLGVAAACLALSARQEISIDINPPHLAAIRPLRLFAPIILAFILIASFLTWKVNWDIGNQEQKLSALKLELNGLEEELKPIEQDRQIVREADRFLKDAGEFIKTRPRIFTIINEIALCLPEETWFSNLDFQKGEMTVKGESPDAFKVIEALRSTEIFEQVTLTGSVSREKAGTERFSLSLKLKDYEADN